MYCSKAYSKHSLWNFASLYRFYKILFKKVSFYNYYLSLSKSFNPILNETEINILE